VQAKRTSRGSASLRTRFTRIPQPRRFDADARFTGYVHPYFGERALSEIIGLDLVGFARRLRTQGLAPSTVTVVLSVIRDLLADAAAEGLIPVAPAVRLWPQRRWRAGPPGYRRGHRGGARGVRSSAAAGGADGDRINQAWLELALAGAVGSASCITFAATDRYTEAADQ
jgi:hypothetical protein